MTKHFYIAIALFFTASQQCSAMKKTSYPAVLTEITKQDKQKLKSALWFKSALWVDNNVVALLTTDGCSLYNTTTNKEVKKLTDAPTYSSGLQCIFMSRNKKHLGIMHDFNLDIYDTKEDKIIYTHWLLKSCTIYGEKIQKQWPDIPAFNPADDTIFMPVHNDESIESIIALNYKNKKQTTYLLQCNAGGLLTNIEFHPTKQECIFHINGDKTQILQFDKDPLIKQQIAANEDLTGINKYSPDGSLIAVRCLAKGCLIIDTMTDTQNFLIDTQDSRPVAMVFHPTSSILAILPSVGNYIRYWNAKTREQITATHFPSIVFEYDRSFNSNQRLDFSPDGTKIILTLDDQCFVLKVPFEVLADNVYDIGTKEKCAFTFWAMKQFIHDDKLLPEDVTKLLTYTLLAASKYSESNQQKEQHD